MATSSSGGRTVDYEESAHYRESSKARRVRSRPSASWVMRLSECTAHRLQGNFVLGRLGGDNPDNSHILYAEADLLVEKYPCLPNQA